MHIPEGILIKMQTTDNVAIHCVNDATGSEETVSEVAGLWHELAWWYVGIIMGTPFSDSTNTLPDTHPFNGHWHENRYKIKLVFCFILN